MIPETQSALGASQLVERAGQSADGVMGDAEGSQVGGLRSEGTPEFARVRVPRVIGCVLGALCFGLWPCPRPGLQAGGGLWPDLWLWRFGRRTLWYPGMGVNMGS